MCALLFLFAAGCGPEEGVGDNADGADTEEGGQSGGGSVSTRRAAGDDPVGSSRPAKSGHTPPDLPKPPPGNPPRPPYRVAERVEGKEGYVHNPWTNEEVDVRGIPDGTLVRDPKDPDTGHKFRIPPPAAQEAP